MASPRVLVVSLILALAAFSSAEAGPSGVTLGGRSYVDATSLAARLDAKLELEPPNGCICACGTTWSP